MVRAAQENQAAEAQQSAKSESVEEPEEGKGLEPLAETVEEQPNKEWKEFCEWEAWRLLQNPAEANSRPEYRKLVNSACVPCSLEDQQALRRQWVIDEHARLTRQYERFDKYYAELAKIDDQIINAERNEAWKKEQAKYEADLVEFDRVQRELAEVAEELKKAEEKRAEAAAAEEKALEENRRLAAENVQACIRDCFLN